MKYEVTFHDAHGVTQSCGSSSCEAKHEIVDASDPKSAAIKAFCSIDSVCGDKDFLLFAQDPDNWTQVGDSAWFLDDSGGEASLYPLTVRLNVEGGIT